MTGNIVYLRFGIAEIEGPDAIPVISALSMFAAGSISAYELRRCARKSLACGRR